MSRPGSETRSHLPGFAVWAAISGLAALPACGPGAESPAGRGPLRELVPGRRIEAELRPGETHPYSVASLPDRHLRIVARQAGIDVALAFLSPAGDELATEDARSSGDEVLLVVASGDGPHELRVTAAAAQAPPGPYAVLVEELPAGDDLRAAFRHHLEGRRLAREGKDRLGDARREFEAASVLWERLAVPSLAAYSLFEIGRLSGLMTEPAAARPAYAEAARRFAALGMTGDQAAAQLAGGEARFAEGDHGGAGELWKETLPLEPALTPMDRATLRFDYGINLKEIGAYEESLAICRQAVDHYHALGMIGEELTARSELASIHIMRRDPLSALEDLNAGVALSREAGRPDLEAKFLQRLGLVFWDVGDQDAAAGQWRRALLLHRNAGNRVAEAAVRLLLGDFASHRDDPAGAETSYRLALDLCRATGSLECEARALTRIGSLLAERREHARALELQEAAVELNRRLGNRQSEVVSLLNLGRTLASTGDRARARRTLDEALARTRGEGAGIGEERILAALARLDIEEGVLGRALATLDQILAKVESRQRAALVPALQTTLIGGAQPWYEARTDLLMRRHLAEPRAGWDAKALASAERARARVLLGLLAEARADLHSGIDPDLLARSRAAEVALAAAKTEREIADASRRVQLLEAEIRKSSPVHAALTQPVPLTLDAIRGRVLDEDTVLIEYGLGEERSWLWAVTRDEFVSVPLPPSAEIESAAQRVHQQLSGRPAAGTPAGDEAGMAALSRMLLQPIAGRLSGAWRGRRLAIVPSGSLAYVPFGALPIPAAAPGAAAAGRLIDEHEIVVLPSATVLDVLRQGAAREESAAAHPAAAARIALVGDPVFSADDPRVQSRAASPPTPSPPAAAADSLTRSALVVGGVRGFPRLPFSREEVRSIAALVPEAEALEAIDFRASRALATDGTLEPYRILHFATHGLLNTAHPELSGLVLSLVDEQGRSQDGFLRLQDIYNLRLSADLVVLSACRSALGRRVAGEGLIGLTRGFMHAGAPRVVASLWQVDDSATAELMRRFYVGMLEEGLRPAAALRAAQRSMAGDARWSSPYYWAGFTLEGEWR